MQRDSLTPPHRPGATTPAGPGSGTEPGSGDRSGLPGPRQRKALTIGAVCKLLEREFPEVSISKIRYLEDQKLIAPRRTQGGYRLYSSTDVNRLRTILRLQRDEFLPLRVIRQELASGRAAEDNGDGAAREEVAQRQLRLDQPGEPRHDLQDLLDHTGVEERLVREFEDFGLVRPRGRTGPRRYDDVEREIVKLAGELTRYGVAARNLRVFRTSTEREAALLEQILGPALRSRNKERRREAVETLESLAAVVTQLKHLLLVQDLRRLVD